MSRAVIVSWLLMNFAMFVLLTPASGACGRLNKTACQAIAAAFWPAALLYAGTYRDQRPNYAGTMTPDSDRRSP